MKKYFPRFGWIAIIMALAIVALYAYTYTYSRLRQALQPQPALRPDQTFSLPPGLEKIEHFVFIVQENRSFDHYFGTYPGADGLPRTADGSFRVCVPNPYLNHCSRPY